jgi:3-isopropylmalate dehydratase small subunit
LAIKEAGIGVVIARSFARIFYRNAFNIGLPLLESEEAADAFSEGDRVFIDLGLGEIKGDRDGKQVKAKSIPDFMMEIVQAGGLVKYIKEKGEF